MPERNWLLPLPGSIALSPPRRVAVMSHCPKFAGFFGRPSPPSRGVLRRAVHSLHVERLEDRRVMNADDPLDGGPVGNAASAMVQTPYTPATAADDAPATFQSREALRQWLIEVADQQFGNLFGQRHRHWSWGWPGHILTADLLNGGFDLNGPVFRTMEFATTRTTNVQVAGVDEADLVETDGEHLYIISGRDLVIVRAGVGEELEILSRIRLDRNVTGMYLDGDRLALVSTEGPHYYSGGLIGLPFLTLATDTAVFIGSEDQAEHRRGPTTTVTLLDVSDRTAPTLVKKTEFDGWLVDSRTVNGQLRLVLSNDFNLPSPHSRPVEDDPSVVRARPGFSQPTSLISLVGLVRPAMWTGDYAGPQLLPEYEYESRDEYIERVIDALLDDLPSVRDVSSDGDVTSETALVAADSLYRPEHKELSTLTTVATIDMRGSGRVVDKASVMTSGQPIVYGSENSLYLLSESWAMTWASGDNLLHVNGPRTNVWKFDFAADTHDVQLSAKGHVSGTILNHFAVDEHDGYLRVVTTNHMGGGQQLQVLKQTGKKLDVVGSVGGLAPDESLYSVRFMGDVAFAVTFRQVDPLFVIDLSDPETPEVVGELKVPGYSDYLQMLDDGRLMAIGRDADEVTGLFEELQVSIFDVSDLSSPTLVDRHSFGGGRSTSTQATGDRWTRGDGDHLAVSYFAAAGLVAVPVFSEHSGGWWGGDEDPLFDPGEGGLQIFRVGDDGSLTPVALIEHDDLIHRSLAIDEHLYALSDGMVTVYSVNDLDQRLGELDLTADDSALTPLRAWSAPMPTLADPVPGLAWLPIDAFNGDAEAVAMGPSADPWPLEELAMIAVEDSSAAAASGGMDEEPEQLAAETPAAVALSAIVEVTASTVVAESASAAAVETGVVETVESAAPAQTVGDGGVEWLAQGQSSASELRASRATTPHRKHGRDDSGPTGPVSTAHLTASVAAARQADLVSRDAAFEDEAAMFSAWDEALQLPGLGPLLA